MKALTNFFKSYNKVVLTVAMVYIPLNLLYTTLLNYLLGYSLTEYYLNETLLDVVDFIIITFLGYLVMKYYNIHIFFEKRKKHREKTIANYKA